MTTMSIVYVTNNGHTAALAEAIARGARTVDGMSVHLVEIVQRDINDGRWSNAEIERLLQDSDAIILGSPTYMGMVSARLKTFLEWAFNPWRAARGTTSTGSAPGLAPCRSRTATEPPRRSRRRATAQLPSDSAAVWR